ncbi:hypothetical protein GCM10010329_00170 [Streptomyces spiroverticillatus]|uniref:Uncharacterized protein n=1 Tax=Streptomyces finlayi TaxID=67296 RepID=A0A918WRV9_9ACTN|nr:hypothetical protein GCM10010329_00170 [Streptomyces spiroverticillatus]GHC76501.1 hypothetical protein GCM10010334_00170 [Streptomyces finlayi]
MPPEAVAATSRSPFGGTGAGGTEAEGAGSVAGGGAEGDGGGVGAGAAGVLAEGAVGAEEPPVGDFLPSSQPPSRRVVQRAAAEIAAVVTVAAVDRADRVDRVDRMMLPSCAVPSGACWCRLL